MRALAGSVRQLLPHPAAETAPRVLLVEGEPDMIAARSRGLPAIAVPGVDSWRPEWARWFAGRTVRIVAGADTAGRALAARAANDLAGVARARVVDLAPTRQDAYDLTDWLIDGDGRGLEALR
jgi:DNA primase